MVGQKREPKMKPCSVGIWESSAVQREEFTLAQTFCAWWQAHRVHRLAASEQFIELSPSLLNVYRVSENSYIP